MPDDEKKTPSKADEILKELRELREEHKRTLADLAELRKPVVVKPAAKKSDFGEWD